MSVRISLVGDLDGFKQLETEWNALVSEMEFPQVFYRWEWNWLYYRRFGANCSPFILVAEEQGRMVGIAPLCLTRTKALGLAVRVLEPIATRFTDYGGFLIRGGAHRRRIVVAMLNVLCAHHREWDFVNLPESPWRDSTTAQIMSTIVNFPGLSCQASIASHTPYIDCRSYPGNADLKQIRWLARKREKLAKEGFTFEVGMTASDEFWSEFWRLRDQRWTRQGDSELAFFDDVRAAFGALNLLECSVSRHQGKIVAMHFGFRDGAKVYYYRPIFDRSYREQRVGAVLAHEIVQTYSQSHREIDFLRGDEPYKFWWTDRMDMNYRLIIGRGHSAAAFAYCLAPALGSLTYNIGAPRYNIARRLRSLVHRAPADNGASEA